jgi:benzoyl-CoA reductase subunit C
LRGFKLPPTVRQETTVTTQAHPVIARLAQIAGAPEVYIADWKARTGSKALGILPMNFPVEIVQAAGALPAMVQAHRDAITFGNGLLTEFHCAFTRSISDQAAKGQLAHFDGLVLADHCIQLLGAIDVVRYEDPDKPVFFGQFISAMNDSWARPQVIGKVRFFIATMEQFTGRTIDEAALERSIAVCNENRRLLRAFFDRRRGGDACLSSADLRAIVSAGMVMDREEHSALLRELLAALPCAAQHDADIRLHLSGHFCHAPPAALLELIEDTGVVVVDDDLYYGTRYVSADVRTDLPAVEALAAWYLERNVAAPCPTRVQNNVDWERTLLDSMAKSGAEGLVVLMAKFCEPHMLYYPELRKALDDRGIPHVLIETEHEGMPGETIRTRIEAMLERIRRLRVQAA